MMGRGKIFELLDFPKFANPTVVAMDAALTSHNLVERLSGGGGFMTYQAIWSRLGTLASGHATEAYIDRELTLYREDWKNKSLKAAARLLAEHFGGRGQWYDHPRKPLRVSGFWFKPSIKGFWFVDSQAYAVLINPRKTQRLVPEHISFLARGIHELHCIDDPNDPVPLIVDLSEHQRGQGRELRVHTMPIEQAISLDEFDASVRQFLKALELAGVAVPPDAPDVINLFKRLP